MIRKGDWRKVAGLSSADVGTLVEASVLLPVVAVALRRYGWRQGQATLGRLVRTAAGPFAADRAAATARMVDAAAHRGPWPGNCLERSVVLWFLLARRGLDSEICVGVRSQAPGERPAFHAWVEHDGRVLNDSPGIRREFSVFESA